jgi:Raf kinase inhibitor-like YbhB/YbcL family protein
MEQFMKPNRIALAILSCSILLSSGACISNSGTGLALSSPVLDDGGVMPPEYTCSDDNISPEMNWSGAPGKTRSFVLIVEDIDAPGGNFTHWSVYDMSKSMILLPKRMAPAGKIPGGSRQGTNSFGAVGYSGPCPPVGETHRYVFTIYALDALLDLDPAIGIDRLREVMAPRILEQASLTVTYTMPAQ